MKALIAPRTWKDLENALEVSTGTLSKLAKNPAKLGLAKKSLRETNGRITYQLTSISKKIRAKLDKEKNLNCVPNARNPPKM